MTNNMAEFDYLPIVRNVVYKTLSEAKRPHTKELNRTAGVFEANLCTALFLCALPHLFFRRGQEAQMHSVAAKQLLAMDLFAPIKLDDAERHAELVQQLENIEVRMPFPYQFAGGSGRRDGVSENNLPVLFEMLASSLLLLVWTTFETMAGDLWENAVNVHPKHLALLNEKKASKPKQRETADKQIPLNLLAKHGYNLADKMGTILRRQRFTFQTLDDIQDAYLSAFPRTCKSGQATFWQNPSLLAVCQIRNVIAHRAGIVDAKFVQRCGPHPIVAKFKENQRFVIGALELKELILPFTLFALELIGSVDGWIVANP